MNKTLDAQWVELLKEARNMGLAPEEIRAFLTMSNLENSPKRKTANPLS
ncbi:anti-repressor SinI family protein [Salimicrobium halophilum]|nr:anti-repressor SinI family protein [Salimicrobium halophilum]